MPNKTPWTPKDPRDPTGSQRPHGPQGPQGTPRVPGTPGPPRDPMDPMDPRDPKGPQGPQEPFCKLRAHVRPRGGGVKPPGCSPEKGVKQRNGGSPKGWWDYRIYTCCKVPPKSPLQAQTNSESELCYSIIFLGGGWAGKLTSRRTSNLKLEAT